MSPGRMCVSRQTATSPHSGGTGSQLWGATPSVPRAVGGLSLATILATQAAQAGNGRRKPAVTVRGVHPVMDTLWELADRLTGPIRSFENPRGNRPIPHAWTRRQCDLDQHLRQRAVVERQVVGAEGLVSSLECYLASARGDRVSIHVVATIPARLTIWGQTAATIALDGRGLFAGVYLVRDPCTIAELVGLHEAVTATGEAVPVTTACPQQYTQLLAALALGLSDAKAARSMRISVRTYARRVAELLDTLRVSTRFQAGMAVTELGWTASDVLTRGRARPSVPDKRPA